MEEEKIYFEGEEVSYKKNEFAEFHVNKQDLLHGYYKKLYSNGSTFEEGYFLHGKHTGVFNYFNKQGILIYCCFFKNGNPSYSFRLKKNPKSF